MSAALHKLGKLADMIEVITYLHMVVVNIPASAQLLLAP
jgi:hypothetical protein